MKKDLPEKEFLDISKKTPLINVDLLIQNEVGEVLLSWRDDEYCGTGWHIPGGIIRHGETLRERLELTALRELKRLPVFEGAPCKITEIFNEQEYRNHFISLLYKGRCNRNEINTVSIESSHQPGDLSWFDYFPGLVYSQAPYERYMKKLMEKKENA